MSFQRFRAPLFVVMLLLVSVWHASAEERIHRFVSNLAVSAEGTVTVTETIAVRAEGAQIKRGIFRDIPLTAEGANGRTYQVGFQLLSVLQDGAPAPHFEKTNKQGVRIYIGAEDTFLKPGDYTYTIKYETDRQVRFFDGYDEVYWNATGNEWAFPIDEAFVRVTMPPGERATEWAAYTGRFGSTDQDYKARVENDGAEVIFQTIKPLRPYEGLTVLVKLPKGAVEAPSESDELGYFLSDFRAELIGGTGALLVLLYYLFAWWKVGRDPAKGVIFARFEAPDGISPALSNYVYNRGFGDGGWLALSSACLNLAVAGHMRLEDQDGTVSLIRNKTSEPRQHLQKDLPRGEAAVKSWLEKRNGQLTISKASGSSIAKLGRSFRKAIEGESRNRYFKSNKLLVIPGAILSVLVIMALIAFGNLSEEQIVIMMPVFMIGVFISVFSIIVGKKARRLGGIAFRIGAAFGVFAVAMLLLGITATGISGGIENLPVTPLLAVYLVAVNIFFFFLIGAPTALGRDVLDQIEGLRLYLSVAEKERMNMADVPEMSTGHFETLLPYAIALGVEKPWAKTFEGWLTAAAGSAVAGNYSPNWYSGRRFNSRDVAGSLGSATSAMAGSFSSSLPAPKSSSSGFSSGGGSSGGGGGGGGGGGW